MSTINEKFRDAVIAQLRDTYDLVFVNYDDKFTPEQVDHVVAGDWESLYETTEEWESDSRYRNAVDDATTEVNDVARQWAREDTVRTLVEAGEVVLADGEEVDDIDFTSGSFAGTSEFDEIVDEIRDRDDSNPHKELAHHTGRVLMRAVIAGEDDAISYTTPTATDVIRWLNEHAEPGTVLKRNQHNVKVVREVLNECSPEFGYLMGMLVYAVDVGDLYDMPNDTEYVEVVNPYLYLGNYYQGDGYCEGPLDAVFRIKRADLRTDKGAPGYGWDEVAGVYTSYYECEIRTVANDKPTTEAAA